jgi:hypothetical protein
MPFHCDAASLLCRCAAHSEEASLAEQRPKQQMQKNTIVEQLLKPQFPHPESITLNQKEFR